MTPPERTWSGDRPAHALRTEPPSADIPALLADAERLRQSKLADVGRGDLLKTINSDGNAQKSMTASAGCRKGLNLNLLSRERMAHSHRDYRRYYDFCGRARTMLERNGAEEAGVEEKQKSIVFQGNVLGMIGYSPAFSPHSLPR